jgi:putative SOS response-associated peptidase YedK
MSFTWQVIGGLCRQCNLFDLRFAAETYVFMAINRDMAQRFRAFSLHQAMDFVARVAHHMRACPKRFRPYQSIADNRKFAMCGRFTSTASPEELMRHFGVTILENLRPRWNVAPSQKVHVIQQTGLHPEAVAATWGLPPATSKHSFLINARMETVAEKPTFRDAFIHHRCLVPATGWYEWSAPKQPWHIQLRDGGPMAMAGLLFRRGGKMNFIIVTSAADGDLAQIHHRQPLVLQRASWQSWLCGGAADAQNCLQATPAQSFNWYRVGTSVGRVAEDHPGLVTPLDERTLADEGSVSTTDKVQGDLFG